MTFSHIREKRMNKNQRHRSKQKWPKKLDDKITSLLSFHKIKF